MCLRSIAGVSSNQALPDYLMTRHHLCAFLMYLARKLCGGKTKTHIYIYIYIYIHKTKKETVHTCERS